MGNGGLIRNLFSLMLSAKDDALAFSLYDGEQLTDISYKQFTKDILQSAGYFRERNIVNEHIALMAPNSYDWLVAFFAITASGNTAVLLNQYLPAELIKPQCADADVSMICTNSCAVPPASDMPEDIFCIEFDKLKSANPISAEDIHSYDADDTVFMMCTSGTTGKSKIVEFSSQNIQAYLDDGMNVLPIPEGERTFLSIPLFHVAGLLCVLVRIPLLQTTCIGRGAQYMLLDMPMLNPTYVALVPSMIDSIVKLFKRTKTPEERQKYVGTKLVSISVGGAHPNPDDCRFLINSGYNLYTAYGMTETAGAGTWCRLNEQNLGTIGKIYGQTQWRIEDGELLLKGPSVMKGYYKDPKETAKIIEDGWIHTGDIARCDEDGCLYIVGRKKNVIILASGENVNPEEVEARLMQCSSINECMVFSDGRGICADVCTNNEQAASEYIREYNDQVPMYRQVYKVNYSAEPLEKTGTGKIKRRENI